MESRTSTPTLEPLDMLLLAKETSGVTPHDGRQVAVQPPRRPDRPSVRSPWPPAGPSRPKHWGAERAALGSPRPVASEEDTIPSRASSFTTPRGHVPTASAGLPWSSASSPSRSGGTATSSLRHSPLSRCRSWRGLAREAWTQRVFCGKRRGGERPRRVVQQRHRYRKSAPSAHASVSSTDASNWSKSPWTAGLNEATHEMLLEWVKLSTTC